LKDIFEIAVEAYKQFGLSGVFSAVLLMLILLLIYEVGRHFLTRLIDRFIPLHRKFNPLKSSFYDKMDILIYYKTPRMNIECPLREKIFKKILKICFSCWKTRAQNKLLELDSLNPEEYLNFWRNFVYKTTDTWEAEAKQAGIPEIALIKFRVLHKRTLELMMSSIEQVCLSHNVYDTNSEKTIVILDFIAILLDMALIDAESTADQINGELSQLEFEGVKCTNCDKHCDYQDNR